MKKASTIRISRIAEIGILERLTDVVIPVGIA